ncbi:MAG: hypothetical protein AB7O28_07960 [Vicinamibacterales bacterium]
MYEHRRHRPITRGRFTTRLLRHGVAAVGLVAGSLLIGMAGYVHYEALSWRDAFLNAAMLLGGMGPVDPPRSDGGKVFAGLYSLYCGLVFLVVTGLLLAPFVHRLLHKFHWEADRE